MRKHHKVKFSILFFIVAGILLDSGTAYSKNRASASYKAAKQKLKIFLGRLQKKGIDSSVVYYDLQTRKTIFEHNSQKSLIPASIIKMLTSYVFVKKLGLDYRFKTEIYAQGNLKGDGVLEGNLVIKGHGDPSLNSDQMAQISQELYLQGLREIKGDILVDNSFLDDQVENESIEGEDLPETDRPFDATTIATSYNWNSICFYISAGNKISQSGKVQLDPENEYVKINNQTQTATQARKGLTFSRDLVEQKEIFTIKGDLALNSTAKRYWKNIAAPKTYAGYGLKHFLAEKKISVTGSVVLGQTSPSSILLYTLESKPLSQIIQDMNKNSLNFVATLLVKTLGAELKGAPGTIIKGTQVIKEEMASWGYSTDAIKIESGSGLNRQTRISSDLLTKVMLKILRSPFGPEIMSSISLSGLDGTLKKRYKNVSYQVRGKTGSLRGVASLLGLLYQPNKSQGDLYAPKVLSIILNNTRSRDVYSQRDMVDEIVDFLDKID